MKQIVDSKQIKLFTIIISIISTVFVAIPIILYFYNFNEGFSNSQSTWGAFGDYIGGIIGTIFSLLAVIFSLFSIYITLKIAERLNENEQDFQLKTQERETKRFEKEIELLEKQNRPFPQIDLNRFGDKAEIVLSNEGPGTLIITNWQIENSGIIHRNFGEMFQNDYSKDLTYGNETLNKLTITSGNSKKLLEVYSNNAEPTIYKKCIDLVKNSVIRVEYKDIFDKEFSYEEDLSKH